MSSHVESTKVGAAGNNRRILVRRTLIASLILLSAACAWSFFLVVRFHSTVAVFQKQKASLWLSYKNSRGDNAISKFGGSPGPAFIPAPLLRYHRSVTCMGLSRQPGSTDEEIDELFRLLPQLSKMIDLNLQGFRIDRKRAAAIASLPRLKNLGLSRCQLEKSCLADLQQLAGLTRLSLENSVFQEAELQAIIQGTTQETLTRLNLSGCQITDQSAPVISQCRNLELLFLDDTQISDQGLKILARLPQLKVLVLDHTPVTDAGVAYLSSTPRLIELSLSNTGTSDDIVESLKQDIPALRISDD